MALQGPSVDEAPPDNTNPPCTSRQPPPDFGPGDLVACVSQKSTPEKPDVILKDQIARLSQLHDLEQCLGST